MLHSVLTPCITKMHAPVNTTLNRLPQTLAFNYNTVFYMLLNKNISLVD